MELIIHYNIMQKMYNETKNLLFSLLVWLYKYEKLELINGIEYRTIDYNLKSYENYDEFSNVMLSTSCSDVLNYLDTIPSCIRVNIFKFIDHSNLLNLLLAYSRYMIEVCISWHKIGCLLDKVSINDSQLKLLVKHLSHNLRDLNIDAEIITDAKDFFKYFTSLTRLRIIEVKSELVVQSICENLINLRSIEIDFKELNDDHVYLIGNCLKNLNSISFHTTLDINSSVLILIDTLECIKKFDLQASLIKNKLIQELIRKHANNLYELHLSSLNSKYRDSALVNLKNCFKLKCLTLDNMHLSQKIHILLDSLDNLEILELKKLNIFNKSLKLPSSFECFRRSKPKIRSVKIKHLMASHSFYESFSETCPNLKDIYLERVTFSREFGIVLSKNKSLESLRIAAIPFLMMIYIVPSILNGEFKNLKFLHIDSLVAYIILDNYRKMICEIQEKCPNLQLVHCYNGGISTFDPVKSWISSEINSKNV